MRKALIILVVGALVVFGLLRYHSTDPILDPVSPPERGLTSDLKERLNRVTGDSAPQPTSQSARDQPSKQPDERIEKDPSGGVRYLPTVELSRKVTRQTPTVEVISQLQGIFAQYRFAFGNNPVGVENFEFTKGLLGNNPKNVIFVAGDSAMLDGGELVDEWGTPFFFHPVSAKELQIISAGADREFWTDDDIGEIDY